MGMQDFSKTQQGIIKRYYDNIDGISLQKLGELVTELYLAEGKKREKLWKTAVSAMQKLGVPQTRIDLIVAKNSPEAVAALVKELSAKSG